MPPPPPAPARVRVADPPPPEADWLSFLPTRLAGSLPDPRTDLGRPQLLRAVALLADVSGFTALCEALGGAGPRGTEQVTAIVNEVFAAMVARVHRHGGEVVHFAGDA